MDGMSELANESSTGALDWATERWDIDSARSSLTFNLRHIVVHQIGGRFERWGGTLYVNRRDPSLSSVHIWIDLASITTDDPERDAHVRSAEFLDVAPFPRAEFHSTDVRIADGEIVVEGSLDLHGVVRDVEMRAIAAPAGTGADDRPRNAFTARGALDRQAFGLHWNQDLDIGGVVIGDEVEIVGHAELVHANGAPAASGSSGPVSRG
jgi:polyisoprenoid-binding protein YceI